MSSREWVEAGTALCREALRGDLDEPSRLPGWTRRHVAAHLSLNAEGLGNLVEWARTGEERPMYPSAEVREADIQAAVSRSPEELRVWFDSSAEALDAAMSALSGAQWQATVRTMQGKHVPATEIPWMRAREVMIHAVDLGAGVTFDDLPRRSSRRCARTSGRSVETLRRPTERSPRSRRTWPDAPTAT